jgi:hypothetical protein
MTEDIQKCFDLSHNDTLHSLHLNDQGAVVDESLGGHIPMLLSQITSLEELFIDISDASAIGSKVWTKIDLQLDHPRLSNLRRLNFTLDADRRAKDIGFIKGRLPLCTARGIVRFH